MMHIDIQHNAVCCLSIVHFIYIKMVKTSTEACDSYLASLGGAAPIDILTTAATVLAMPMIPIRRGTRGLRPGTPTWTPMNPILIDMPIPRGTRG
ncbi:hypothetical protein F5148DRAFT_1243188, partial [Russula earlei]